MFSTKEIITKDIAVDANYYSTRILYKGLPINKSLDNYNVVKGVKEIIIEILNQIEQKENMSIPEIPFSKRLLYAKKINKSFTAIIFKK
jgi:hypothetical protein